MALSKSIILAGRVSRPALGSARQTPLVTFVRRHDSSSSSEPSQPKTWREALYEKPLVKSFRKWYGMDQPLYDLSNYPVLPRIHASELPEYGWYDNYDRRNKNTILHEDHEILSLWSPDVYAPDKNYHLYKDWYPIFYITAIVGTWYLLFKGLRWYFDRHPESELLNQAKVPKLYPYGNLYLERGGDQRFEDGFFPSGPANIHHPNLDS